MSEAVSALAGARFEGFCTVEEAGLMGMITLRADLGSEAVAKAVKPVTGSAIPGRGETVFGKSGRAAWMSPDELLLIVDYPKAGENVAALNAALAGEHALVVNVSDARAVFRVTGPRCREVMAKLTPANVATDAFAPGQWRRTRLAQVAAAFHMPDAESFEIVCFRSVAQYMFDLLSNAARTGGEVGVF
jgi:sarcosine oxidase subunit gamma